ncbi:MAG: hypothetical protein AAFW69_12330, partial [Pseudomonadota bacterium]
MTLVCGNTRPQFPEYSSREIAADAAVHLIGIVAGSIAAFALIRDALAQMHTGLEVGATLIYALGLVA